MALCTLFDQVWADGSSAAAQQRSSVSSLSKSLTEGGSSRLPVRWARMNDESVCLIGWEMEEHGKNEATYLPRWFNGGGVSPASSLWEHSSCFSWYCWLVCETTAPPPPSSFVCSGWHVWLFIIKGKGVAGAINMWLCCIWFSTDKAASLTDMRSSLKNLRLCERDWIKGGSEAAISLWQRSADKYFFWSPTWVFFLPFSFFCHWICFDTWSFMKKGFWMSAYSS